MVWKPLAANVSSIRIAAVVLITAVAMTPLGLMAAATLENRFPQPAADMPPPFGIIVLGVPSTARSEATSGCGSITAARCLSLTVTHPCPDTRFGKRRSDPFAIFR